MTSVQLQLLIIEAFVSFRVFLSKHSARGEAALDFPQSNSSLDEKGAARLTPTRPRDVGGIFEWGGHGHGVQCRTLHHSQAVCC